eukprot:m.233875 g.233875  ORF g.233875 m.233875 type:complete len:1093 (-) comp15250_c0_seq3:24-3302(-)
MTTAVVSAGNSDRSKSPPVPVETFEHDGRVEEFLQPAHLHQLMAEFQKEEFKELGLDMQRFCDIMAHLVEDRHIPREQLALLFMKIDTSCDGNVDWDEFCTYMLLDFEGDGAKSKHPAKLLMQQEATPITQSPVLSKPSLSCIGFQPTTMWTSTWLPPGAHRLPAGKFFTIADDGTLNFYKQDLTLVKAMRLSFPQRTMRATACVMLPAMNKLAVSFTNRTVRFYDTTCSLLEEVCQLAQFDDSILSASCHVTCKGTVVYFGDLGGRVHALQFPENRFHLISRVLDGVDPYRPVIDVTKLSPDVYQVEQLHSDWVEQVCGYSELGHFVSCSGSSKESVVLRDDAITVFAIPKGIRTIDVCPHASMLVTGGNDGVVSVWSLHMNQRPSFTLSGHKSGVLSVVIQCIQCQRRGTEVEGTVRTMPRALISISSDKAVKIWSLETQRQLYTIPESASFPYPEPLTAVYYDSITATLLFGNRHFVGINLQSKVDVETKHTKTHSREVVDALYNPLFNQVATASRDAEVTVWSFSTGEKLVKFSHAHGSAEITTMAFDRSYRRLLTGASDGSVKLWNFNIGLALIKLVRPTPADLASVLELKSGSIVSGGWDRTIRLYSKCKGETYYVLPDEATCGVHPADISCLLELGSMFLASATITGHISVWKVTEAISHVRTLDLGARFERCRVTCMLELQASTPEVGRLRRGYSLSTISNILVAGAAGGTGHVWLLGLRFGKVLGSMSVGCHAITSMTKHENTLVTADDAGHVRVWDISGWLTSSASVPIVHGQGQSMGTTSLNGKQSILATSDMATPVLLSKWRAHLDSISSVSLADSSQQINGSQNATDHVSPTGKPPAAQRGSDSCTTDQVSSIPPTTTFIMTSSQDCSVRVWTLRGEYVGTFGQASPWDASIPSTWQYPKMPADVDEHLKLAQQAAMQDETRTKSETSASRSGTKAQRKPDKVSSSQSLRTPKPSVGDSSLQLADGSTQQQSFEQSPRRPRQSAGSDPQSHATVLHLGVQDQGEPIVQPQLQASDQAQQVIANAASISKAIQTSQWFSRAPLQRASRLSRRVTLHQRQVNSTAPSLLPTSAVYNPRQIP